ncbi:MAG: ATPase domain protein [Ilumatobacteraceae bacterium]|nr:ATPase domain protein [Ilumatobacteraceae bacterium]
MTLEVGDAPGRSPTRGSTRYGARPLRRFIAYEVATRMSRALLAGEVHEGAVIRIEPVEGELAVTYENPKCERPAA